MPPTNTTLEPSASPLVDEAFLAFQKGFERSAKELLRAAVPEVVKAQPDSDPDTSRRPVRKSGWRLPNGCYKETTESCDPRRMLTKGIAQVARNGDTLRVVLPVPAPRSIQSIAADYFRTSSISHIEPWWRYGHRESEVVRAPDIQRDNWTAGVAQVLLTRPIEQYKSLAAGLVEPDTDPWDTFIQTDVAGPRLADYRRHNPSRAVEILRSWIAKTKLPVEYEAPLSDGSYATALVAGRSIQVDDDLGLDSLNSPNSPHIRLTAKSLLDGSFEKNLASLVVPVEVVREVRVEVPVPIEVVRKVPVEVIKEVEIIKEVIKEVTREVPAPVVKSKEDAGPATFQFKRDSRGGILEFTRLVAGQRTSYSIKRDLDGNIIEVGRPGDHGPVRFFFTRSDDTLTVRKEPILLAQ